MPTTKCTECGTETEVHPKVGDLIETGRIKGAYCDECEPEYNWEE